MKSINISIVNMNLIFNLWNIIDERVFDIAKCISDDFHDPTLDDIYSEVNDFFENEIILSIDIFLLSTVLKNN